LQGAESADNLELNYQPSVLQADLPELTPHLLAGVGQPRILPASLVRELTAYPGWQATSLPGARVAPVLLQLMGSDWK